MAKPKRRRTCQDEKWRQAVFERDNYTCQDCGKTEDLSTHHIKSYAEFPELRLDVSNGVTLCCYCHCKLHGWYKNTNNGRRGEVEQKNRA